MKEAFAVALTACTAISALAAGAQDGTGKAGGLRERVEALYRQDAETYKGRADVLVRPGLVADRKAGRVRVYVKATGISPLDIVEFYILTENSGHDYEALTVAFAKALDVHRALEFIGMRPGRPIAPAKLCFWPKGERVTASVRSLPAEAPFGPVRMTALTASRDSGNAIEDGGFVFVGSAWVDSVERPGDKAYAADVSGPNSIASNYNEPTTVLDIPRRATQGEVYGTRKANPNLVLPTNTILEVILEPERREDGCARVIDLELEARPRPGSRGEALGDCVFDLRGGAGAPNVPPAAGLNAILGAFASLRQQDRDPFVTPRFDAGLTVGALHELCGILSSIETERGIRVEPPAAGQLYYRAFLPNELHRKREDRISQPWELHLSRANGRLVGKLVHIEEIWNNATIQPQLRPSERPVATPEELLKGLREMGKGLPVIFVYARTDLTHGELMSLLAPALPTHPTIHVFISGSGPARPEDKGSVRSP